MLVGSALSSVVLRPSGNSWFAHSSRASLLVPEMVTKHGSCAIKGWVSGNLV